MLGVSWVKAAPWLACFVLALMVAFVAHAYMAERDEFTAYRAVVEALGKKAAEDKIKTEELYKQTLEKVKQHEKDIPAIRSAAVAAYKLRFPDAGRCSLPGASFGVQPHDGTRQESMASDQFIQDCGDDADKVEAWRAWAILNGIKIK